MSKLLILPAILIFLVSCDSSMTGGTATVTSGSYSVSEVAAESVGGALGGSDQNGTVSHFHILPLLLNKAYASNSCPTIASTSGCTTSQVTISSTAYNVANMSYSACSFGGSLAQWTGTMQMSLSSPSTGLSCGAFPTATSVTIQRQFVQSGSPGTATRVASDLSYVIVDNASTNLTNFDNDSITANISSGGYGTQVTFNSSGARTGVTVKERLYNNIFDHSINGSVTIAETTNAGVKSWTATGTVQVYHNKLKIIGTATFNSVVYKETCATPVSGSISTTFAAGSNSNDQPGLAGNLIITASQSHPETLTFSGCGSMTLTSVNQTTSNPTAASF